MSEQQIFAIAIIVFVVLGMLILFFYIRMRHKEKMELIKKGDYGFQSNYLENMKYNVLGKSIVLIALALGFGIAFGITQRMEGTAVVVIYLISLLSSIGIGLCCFYFIIKKALK
ncbi:DUF6249 domain-containing protein [Chitinophaga vietnamensis]|uniref:DUF6249 domain-containing protein n=1 Tax=Chitinophaga vietnamensis TaxID=2593957 RepID=UPI001177C28D|nr:DUF6249 domain-containing protein [Chitinophaga vietnamensis]